MEANQIQTGRLTLRPPRRGDEGQIHEYAGDPGLTMMIFLPNGTFAETERFVANAEAEWAKDEPENREYVIVFDGRIIGGTGLERLDGDGTFEIGWVLHRDFRGQGFATETARALKEYAFRGLGANRLIAHCDSRNAASEHVMRKLGMRMVSNDGVRVYEKTGITASELEYELTREQWLAEK